MSQTYLPPGKAPNFKCTHCEKVIDIETLKPGTGFFLCTNWHNPDKIYLCIQCPHCFCLMQTEDLEFNITLFSSVEAK